MMSLGLSTSAQNAPSDKELLIEARKEVSILASRQYAGRGYTKEGHLKAAEYIARRFAEIGLKPAPLLATNKINQNPYFQPFTFPLNVIESATVYINGKEQRLGNAYIVGSDCPSSKGMAKIDFAGYGLTTLGIEGKEGLHFIDGLPPEIKDNPTQKEKYKALASVDAKKQLLSALSPRILLAQRNGKLTHSFADEQSTVPSIEFLADSFPQKLSEIKWDIRANLQNVQTQNVIGMVKGTTFPDSFLLVSAHYDHLGAIGNAVFSGANDNASGMATLLSLASHFTANPPKYSIIFLAFGAEETGLNGSKYYVQQQPVVPLERTKFILNIDLMGGGNEGIMAVGGQDFPDIFQKLVDLNTELSTVPIVKARKNAPNSDHYYFLLNGVKGFFIYTMGGPPWYHDIFDKPENLEFQKFTKIRKLFIEFLTRF